MDKDALKAAKKEHKAKVKAEAAEKRKTKIPKHLKEGHRPKQEEIEPTSGIKKE